MFGGAKYALMATFLFTLLNAGVKYVTDVPTIETVFFRFLFGFIILLPLTPREAKLEFFQPGAPRWIALHQSVPGSGCGAVQFLCREQVGAFRVYCSFLHDTADSGSAG